MNEVIKKPSHFFFFVTLSLEIGADTAIGWNISKFIGCGPADRLPLWRPQHGLRRARGHLLSSKLPHTYIYMQWEQ